MFVVGRPPHITMYLFIHIDDDDDGGGDDDDDDDDDEAFCSQHSSASDLSTNNLWKRSLNLSAHRRLRIERGCSTARATPCSNYYLMADKVRTACSNLCGPSDEVRTPCSNRYL